MNWLVIFILAALLALCLYTMDMMNKIWTDVKYIRKEFDAKQ